MIELFHDPNYDFIGKRRWAYLVSILFIVIGLTSIVAKGGLRYNIDFTGGTLMQLRFERPPEIARIRTALGKIGLGESVIQQFGDPREYILRMPLTATNAEEVARRVQGVLAGESAAPRSNFRIDQAALATAVGAVPERVHSPATALADVARAYRTASAERPLCISSLDQTRPPAS